MRKPHFQDTIMKVTSEVSVQQLKKYIQSKFLPEVNIEMNEIEIYININGEKSTVLKNKEKISDLIQKGLWKEEKLEPDRESYLNYWNGYGIADTEREYLQVKIKH